MHILFQLFLNATLFMNNHRIAVKRTDLHFGSYTGILHTSHIADSKYLLLNKLCWQTLDMEQVIKMSHE